MTIFGVQRVCCWALRRALDLQPGEDIRELRRSLAATSLALANSAAYAQCLEAEAMISRLYQHLQVVQHTTATAIACEPHDEIAAGDVTPAAIS
jgi:hypothetical protein